MILWKICKIYASPIIDTLCAFIYNKNKFSNDLLIRKGGEFCEMSVL